MYTQIQIGETYVLNMSTYGLFRVNDPYIGLHCAEGGILVCVDVKIRNDNWIELTFLHSIHDLISVNVTNNDMWIRTYLTRISSNEEKTL
jgi:hypothetical protein